MGLTLGWARGFLDAERKKLEDLLKKDGGTFSYDGRTIHIGHPREVVDAFAAVIVNESHEAWFA